MTSKLPDTDSLWSWNACCLILKTCLLYLAGGTAHTRRYKRGKSYMNTTDRDSETDMNHLRDLLDSLQDSANAPIESGVTAKDLDRMADWCALVGEQAVAFSMGDIATVIELQVVPELVRLPYPTCWFECEIYPPSQPDVVMCGGLLINTLDDGSYFGQVWTKLRGEWRFIGKTYGTAETAGNWKISSETEKIFQIVGLQTKAAQCFLSALHCSNVRRQEHAPDAKLQKARAKRGKAPLFSYWTLQLNGNSNRAKDQGGTHASQRVHLVRGHPRQYAPNKWTWVQAYAKGNKALGLVQKDYSATPKMLAAARHNAESRPPASPVAP